MSPDVAVVKLMKGLTQAESGGVYPADPWVAVNGTYVLQSVNLVYRVFNRAGTALVTVPDWALFAVPPGQFTSDSRILWDPTHGRWVGVLLSFAGDYSVNYLHVAVSDGSDPTAGWTIYPFAYSGALPDYPSIASSTDKITVTGNLFDTGLNPLGADVLTISWSSVLAGAAIVANECFASGLAVPRAAQNQSAGSDIHLISVSRADGSQYYDRITGSGTCSQIHDETNISAAFSWAPFASPPDPRQPGPDALTNAVDGRPTDAVWMAGKLWWVSTWPVSYDAGATQNDAVVLWGANVPAGTGVPTANDIETITAGDGVDSFMGGIGFSRNGTLFVTYSQSSAASNIAWYANRVTSGGTLGTPQLLDISDATTAQDRWGDFAGVATDPIGTGTVWASHMLVSDDGTWRTDIAQLLEDTDLPSTPGPAVANAEISKVLTNSPSYRFGWSPAADANSGQVTYRIQMSVDGGPFASATWQTATTLTRALAFGHTYAFQATAFDPLGSFGGTSTSPTVRPVLYQSPTSRTGTWTTSSSSNYAGGTDLYATAAGASATFSTTGIRSLALVTPRGPTRGSFKVYVDGVYRTTISTYSSTSSYRQIVYQITFSTAATHTIKIVVSGTAGHPRVDLDAYLVLK